MVVALILRIDVNDFVGKTVSLNTVQCIGDTTVRRIVDAAGGDQSKTKLVDVAFPDVETALTNKQIDATYTVSPFLEATIANGLG